MDEVKASKSPESTDKTWLQRLHDTLARCQGREKLVSLFPAHFKAAEAFVDLLATSEATRDPNMTEADKAARDKDLVSLNLRSCGVDV